MRTLEAADQTLGEKDPRRGIKDISGTWSDG
jgi:hypothetical protein